jgi:hypothetical protein
VTGAPKHKIQHQAANQCVFAALETGRNMQRGLFNQWFGGRRRA